MENLQLKTMERCASIIVETMEDTVECIQDLMRMHDVAVTTFNAQAQDIDPAAVLVLARRYDALFTELTNWLTAIAPYVEVIYLNRAAQVSLNLNNQYERHQAFTELAP